MAESISSSPQLQSEDMILNHEPNDAALRELFEMIESGDHILVELAEELGIQLNYDAPLLTPEQRQALINKCLAGLGYHAFDTTSSAIREKKEPSEEEQLVEQAEALGKQFDYDGSVLTPEQRRALFKKYWAMHLEMLGLRSPQYYGDKSQCLSVSETAWPGTVTYLEAEKLKRGYIEPEDLIERLRKLKPSDNFEPRKFRHPRMSWRIPTPLQEEGYEILPPDPDWLLDQLYAVNRMWRRLGRQLTDQRCREITDRWAAIESGAELMSLPDLHLLRDMGRSSDGTIFPWYLVKGLIALREHANDQGTKSYAEDYDSAMLKREEAIEHWKKRNPDSILADDPLSIYNTWPADLMDELNEIDREAIRCGRRKYVAILREAEKKMQELVAFWRAGGLVTGQRTSPTSWWKDPKAEVECLPKPKHVQDQLDAINTEFGYHSDKAEKLRMIETSRWIEVVINCDSVPTATDTPLPQYLLDELDVVWRDRDWLDDDDTEDEMIAIFRRWRTSQKLQQRLQEGLRTSPQFGSDISPEEPVQRTSSPVTCSFAQRIVDSPLGLAIASEETHQLQEKQPSGARRWSRTNITIAKDRAVWQGRLRSRTNPMIAHNPTIWQDRLRPRHGTIAASRRRPHSAERGTGKPRGIVKQYSRETLVKKRQSTARDPATTATTQKTGILHLSSPQSHFNKALPQSTPTGVTRARSIKTLRRQFPHKASIVQPEGVQKARNSKGRRSRRLMTPLTTNHNQGLLRLLTPPQSE